MKRTQTAALQEIFHAYQKSVGGRPVTMDEVSEWAIANCLWPTPQHRSPPVEWDEWEKKFAPFAAARCERCGRIMKETKDGVVYCDCWMPQVDPPG